MTNINIEGKNCHIFFTWFLILNISQYISHSYILIIKDLDGNNVETSIGINFLKNIMYILK